MRTQTHRTHKNTDAAVAATVDKMLTRHRLLRPLLLLRLLPFLGTQRLYVTRILQTAADSDNFTFVGLI